MTQPRSSRGAAFGDFDNDGDVDVLVMNMNEPPALLRNDYAGSNRWLAVQLEGRASNRSAIGATVRVTVAGRTQAQAVLSQSSYYSHNDLRLHFGLGTHRAAERIEVRWPSGAVTTPRGCACRAGPADSRVDGAANPSLVSRYPGHTLSMCANTKNLQ